MLIPIELRQEAQSHIKNARNESVPEARRALIERALALLYFAEELERTRATEKSVKAETA